ncbi:hypothetical protein DMUE_4604 [Dictyocoela muelleri]|nr:hypothetical protein DMUE_4604 [Dictyocoela muelleri]
MGSVSNKRTLENKKRKKLKASAEYTALVSDTDSNQRMTHRISENIDEELLTELIMQYLGKNIRIVRGGWPKLTAKYNLRKKNIIRTNTTPQLLRNPPETSKNSQNL